MSRRRKPAPKHVDEVIGVGYVLRETGLLEPTTQLLEIEAVKQLLASWNRDPGAAWSITDRPDKRERQRPAPDFVCTDARTGSTALIDVAELPPEKRFAKRAKGPRSELVITESNARKNIQRLLRQKNEQLAGPADRRCILFLFPSDPQDLMWLWLSSILKSVGLAAYPNIYEVYVWSQRPYHEPLRILP